LEARTSGGTIEPQILTEETRVYKVSGETEAGSAGESASGGPRDNRMLGALNNAPGGVG